MSVPQLRVRMEERVWMGSISTPVAASPVPRKHAVLLCLITTRVAALSHTQEISVKQGQSVSENNQNKSNHIWRKKSEKRQILLTDFIC